MTARTSTLFARWLALWLTLLSAVAAHAQPPRIPFFGIYGGTAGAGSVVAWDRNGGGENPAALGAPGLSASLAGYAPFGLEDVQVFGLAASRDQPRWGISTGVEILSLSGKVDASRARIEGAFRPAAAWLIGVRAEVEAGVAGVAAGVLWRPARWSALGAFVSPAESSFGPRFDAGVGLDLGGALARGSPMAWRACAEAVALKQIQRGEASSSIRLQPRLGLALRLHALLSVYSGWNPALQTVALGASFGIGDWEGFSAMRRHAALGGTSLQGIGWHRISPQ